MKARFCEWRGGTSVLPRGEKGAIHDNRMFTERAFYCIANGAGERPGEGHCGTDYKHIYQLCWC